MAKFTKLIKDEGRNKKYNITFNWTKESSAKNEETLIPTEINSGEAKVLIFWTTFDTIVSVSGCSFKKDLVYSIRHFGNTHFGAYEYVIVLYNPTEDVIVTAEPSASGSN